jgi:hypothetical protein
MIRIKISLTEDCQKDIYNHLFPGDGLEAVSLALAGKSVSEDITKFTLFKVFNVPYNDCVRKPDRVTWSTEKFRDVLIEAETRNLTVIKIHSHPTAYPKFSGIDNISDNEMFHTVQSWTGESDFLSMVMLPNMALFGRLVQQEDQFISVNTITVVGDDIKTFSNLEPSFQREFDERNHQAFGPATVNALRNMRIAVVGCSGTGSIVIEQLIRLGVGELILVDPDRVEVKNLNRILNSTYADAENRLSKVKVFERLAQALESQTKIKGFQVNMYDSIDAIKAVSVSDMIFGCVDSVDGRHILNLNSSFYCTPFFDLGVKLVADGKGGIEKICGTVHYIKPGGSSLLSRGVYNIEDLVAAAMLRVNPEDYQDLLKEKYIKNVNIDSPAVISVNMQVASTAVNEFLCRIHKIRAEHSSAFAITRICISDGYLQYEPEEDADPGLKRFLGRGDCQPLLNLPELSHQKDELAV